MACCVKARSAILRLFSASRMLLLDTDGQRRLHIGIEEVCRGRGGACVIPGRGYRRASRETLLILRIVLRRVRRESKGFSSLAAPGAAGPRDEGVVDGSYSAVV